MSTRRGLSSGAATALTTTYAAIAVSKGGADTRDASVPDSCWLSLLHGQIITIATGATTITWYLAADSGGDVALTDELSTPILVGKTTATDGSVAELLDIEYFRSSEGTAGSIWVIAKTDVGTCTLTPRIYFREDDR